MRYRIAALVVVSLPVMNVLAAPAPPPVAILDIGPPPKGETAEAYLKRLIAAQTHPLLVSIMGADPAVKKLPSVARLKNADPWLTKNLRITELKGARRFRISFRAGDRTEQEAIINALLRVNLGFQQRSIENGEYWIRRYEADILECERRIKSSRNPQEIASLRKGIDSMRTKDIPAFRADISRRKQFAVFRWAK